MVPVSDSPWQWYQCLTHPGCGGQADHAAVLRGEERAAGNEDTQSLEHSRWMHTLPDLSVGRGGVPPMRSSSSSSDSEMEEAKVTADSRSSPLRPSSLISSARPFAGRPLSPSSRSNCTKVEGRWITSTLYTLEQEIPALTLKRSFDFPLCTTKEGCRKNRGSLQPGCTSPTAQHLFIVPTLRVRSSLCKLI